MNTISRNMKKPKIYRFEVRGQNHRLRIKKFVEFTEYERLEAKYKELWEGYLKLQNKHDQFVNSF